VEALNAYKPIHSRDQVMGVISTIAAMRSRLAAHFAGMGD